jgi:C-terminal processing protease CtpA/Prc
MAGGFRSSRRRLLACLAGAALAPAAFAAPRASFARDAAVLASDFSSRYAYFDAWARRRFKEKLTAMGPRLRAVSDPEAFLPLLEELLGALQDDHVSVVERGSRSIRRIPGETDIWARWADGYARVEAVRIGSEADSAGLAPGQRIVRVQGIAISTAVQRWSAGRVDDGTRDWAVRHLVAGPWSGPFTLDIAADDGARRIELLRRVPGEDEGQAPMAWRRIGERRDLAYLRLRDGLGDMRLVDELDGLLARLAGARALLLDLRDLNDPGDPAVTRALLGRFALGRIAWQVRQRTLGSGSAKETDYIQGEGVRNTLPVFALVDRWTAGEGESFAAGLQACGATLIGTRMAGLRGITGESRLPHSGLTVRYPVERTLLVDGQPRETLRPQVLVDMSQPSGGPGDPILYQALKSAG